jgi:cytochrome c553
VNMKIIYAAVAIVALMVGVAQADETTAAPELVRKTCSACHGRLGISVSPIFPNLAGQQPLYLETQLKAFRDRSRADPHARAFMWGMAAQLTDDTIKEIAAYFASQPSMSGTHVDSAEVVAGEKIYAEGVAARSVPACQSCHGIKAQGNGPFPRLAGQHRDYLEKQLEQFASNLRANPIMHENAKNLTARQISDVAAFLSSQ